MQRIEYIPDEETEIYFKAADVLVSLYAIFSRVALFFSVMNLVLPVIAADVGSSEEEIVEGETGFVFKRGDSAALAEAIARYFESACSRTWNAGGPLIVEYATERYSWSTVAARTTRVYSHLLETDQSAERIS